MLPATAANPLATDTGVTRSSLIAARITGAEGIKRSYRRVVVDKNIGPIVEDRAKVTS